MMHALVLFVLGLLLSAFFSGCETGFYRATRVRLRLDAMSGDAVSRGLIWLANNPALFVATTLVGNNLANYLASFSIVLGVTAAWPAHQDLLGAVAPVLLAPVVFVYGELLPKNLFHQAPNRLLRLGGPLFLVWAIIFLPASAILWVLGRILQYIVGESPERLQLSLARKELHQVFDEGHDYGLLRPMQRRLAQGMLSIADDSLVRFVVPIGRFPAVKLDSPRDEVLRIARRNRQPLLLVREARGRRVVGYIRVIDLMRGQGSRLDTYCELMEVPSDASPIEALTQLQDQKEPLARVVDDDERTIGLLVASKIIDSMLDGAYRGAI